VFSFKTFWLSLAICPCWRGSYLERCCLHLIHYCSHVFWSQSSHPISGGLHPPDCSHRHWSPIHAWRNWSLAKGRQSAHMYSRRWSISYLRFAFIEYPNSYYLITFITLTSYLTLSLLAFLMSDVKNRSAVVFIAAVSIFSYGLIFEFERGQTYTLSLALCVLAVYFFHWHADFRWLAYLLSAFQFNLSLSRAIVLLFVDDGVIGKIRWSGLQRLGWRIFYCFSFLVSRTFSLFTITCWTACNLVRQRWWIIRSNPLFLCCLHPNGRYSMAQLRSGFKRTAGC